MNQSNITSKILMAIGFIATTSSATASVCSLPTIEAKLRYQQALATTFESFEKIANGISGMATSDHASEALALAKKMNDARLGAPRDVYKEIPTIKADYKTHDEQIVKFKNALAGISMDGLQAKNKLKNDLEKTRKEFKDCQVQLNKSGKKEMIYNLTEDKGTAEAFTLDDANPTDQ